MNEDGRGLGTSGGDMGEVRVAGVGVGGKGRSGGGRVDRTGGGGKGCKERES